MTYVRGKDNLEVGGCFESFADAGRKTFFIKIKKTSFFPPILLFVFGYAGGVHADAADLEMVLIATLNRRFYSQHWQVIVT